MSTMSKTKNTGRMSFVSTVVFSTYVAGRVSAALLTAFLQFPAFISCTPLQTPLKKSAPAAYIDVFFFDTLSPQYLDSYQRLRADDTMHALSSVGVKRVAALSVNSGSAMTWAGVRTYADLSKYSFSLKEDLPERPLLAGEKVLGEGVSRVADLQMRTSLVRIVLRSVSCDFSGTPYTGWSFDNTLIYMQYAGVEARPFGSHAGIPVSTVNQGWLDSAAVMAFPRPEMLLQTGVGNVWRQKVVAEKEFWCYSNEADSAALGRPVTRIVLEGYVGEHLCYYPIELPGLRAGRTYSLDVTLKKMGTPDPDIPASADMVSLGGSCVPWNMYDQREEIF